MQPTEYWLNATQQHDAGRRLAPEEVQDLARELRAEWLARELDATANEVKQVLERDPGLESVLHPAALDEERIGIRVGEPVREELCNELEELRRDGPPHPPHSQ